MISLFAADKELADRNIPLNSATLDVSKLSGWSNAVAFWITFPGDIIIFHLSPTPCNRYMLNTQCRPRISQDMLWPVCALQGVGSSKRRRGAPTNGSTRQPRERQPERLYNRSLPAPPGRAAAPPRPGATAPAAACRHVPGECGLHGKY